MEVNPSKSQLSSPLAGNGVVTRSRASTSNAEPPLCVDLDGTLIHGDTLVISVRQLLCRAPWQAAPLAAALLHGRAAFKAAVASRWIPRPETLRYRANVLLFVREQRDSGRRVVLATAAHRDIALAVARHLGLFEEIIASDGTHNAKSEGKVAAIRQRLGATAEFDYIGDSRADLPVFAAARRSYLVAPSPTLLAASRAVGRVEGVFQD